METVSDRLKHYIAEFTDYTSVRSFEEKLGWSKTTIGNFGNSITEKRAIDLKRFDPKISIEWVLMGLGNPRLLNQEEKEKYNLSKNVQNFEQLPMDKQLLTIAMELETISVINEKTTLENNIMLKLIVDKLGIEEEVIKKEIEKGA